MSRGSVRVLITAGIILGAVLLLRAAGSQAPTSGTSEWYGVHLTGQLQLTPEQSKKLDEIRAKYDAKLLSLGEEVALKRRQLEAAEDNPEADAQTVAGLRRQARELGGKLEDLQAEANIAARRVLTREQAARFAGGFDLFSRGWGWSCPWDRHWSRNAATDPWQGVDCSRWRCFDWRNSTDSGRGREAHVWDCGDCCR